MLELIQNIKFRKTNNSLQTQMRKDIKTIINSEEIFVPADKTTNFYKLKQNKYNELILKNINKEYKKAPSNIEATSTKEDKRIATNLGISDRIDITAKREAFITLKDHKPNFINNPTCRLINPCKTEIGKISKQILDRVNKRILKQTGLNQWKNTDEVIKWYDRIENVTEMAAISFDICDFYPSIDKKLLTKALTFAEQYDKITDEEKEIIMHTKRTTLYYKNTPWNKKNTNCDVAMGSFDGAETCELVGLYLLSQLQHLDINVGLYRDDGLAICKKTPRQTENIKKQICQIFKNNNLRITIEANKHTIDFLDITFQLRTGSYKPYIKQNNIPRYVHKLSNHPPSILKNIPESINKRISKNSSDENKFKEIAPTYNEALKKSGYAYTLSYTKENENNNNKKRTRKRNITWFNAPFSNNVETNIGKKFLKLLDKCFPVNHALHKIMNRNKIKISYSCMPNMKQIITGHNKKILNNNRQSKENTKKCNCRNKENCPLDGKCLISSIVYEAEVTNKQNNEKHTYIGLTENTFKSRYTLHKSSFNNKNKRHSTTLSDLVWKSKEDEIEHDIKWKILSGPIEAYSTTTKNCKLCTEEKLLILKNSHKKENINSRNEINSYCRHRRKHLLSSQ